MNKIKALVIEDEHPVARVLTDMLSNLRPEWEVLLLSGSVKESVTWFQNNPHPDILFLDIQLSDGNSFSFIEKAKPSSMIVFTTAYSEYAIRAFSVNSIDYLLKPIQELRLVESITKFENFFLKYRNEYLQQTSISQIMQSLHSQEKKYRTRFLVPNGEKLLTLSVEEIAYFYSDSKITFMVTKQNKEYILDLYLNKIEEQLDPRFFYRANRQIILNINAIQHIEPYFQNKIIVHTNPPFKEKIIVSRLNATAFKSWLNY